MSRTRLLACPSCARHVRATEPSCPFCASELPASFRIVPAAKPPMARLSRGALYALGATSIGLATACSSASTTPLYGAPADASGQDSNPAPLYGAPADAGPDTGSSGDSAGDAADAGDTGSGDAADAADADSGMTAAYGLPADSGTDGMGALYGGPPPPPDGSAPLYGGPPPADAGDAGTIAAYGLPPH